MITFAVAAVVGIASILVATSVIGPTGRDLGSRDTSTWGESGSLPLRLTFRYPSGWHAQPFDDMIGHIEFQGAVVSNVDHEFRHPDLGPNDFTSNWELSSLPDDAVVVSIEHIEGGPFSQSLPDSKLPLELSDAGATVDTSPGPGWTQRSLNFVLHGERDAVRVWFGPDASVRDQEIARRIVASIGPSSSFHTFGRWTVGVEIEHSASGALEISLGPIHAATGNDAHPWIQHTVILRNTGSVTLHFDDTRFSTFLGPDHRLLAADKGCGYGSDSPGAPVEAGACLLYLDAFSIPPGGSVERPVTLYKDLRGMLPLQAGQYTFEKIYRFRIGQSETKTTVHVRLIYDMEKA